MVLYFEKHKGCYGRIRNRKVLLKEGIDIGEYRIGGIMQRNGLTARGGRTGKRRVQKPTKEQYIKGNLMPVLFGSYAKGTATPRSDVDILVDSGLRGLAFSGLLEDVASSPEVPVDLLDVRQIDSGFGLDREIRKSGVPTYGRQRPSNPAQAVGAHGGHTAILLGLRLPSLFDWYFRA